MSGFDVGAVSPKVHSLNTTHLIGSGHKSVRGGDGCCVSFYSGNLELLGRADCGYPATKAVVNFQIFH